MTETVLVVDDEFLIRWSIADALREEGYNVLEASNAEEAIAALEADSTIRLIFTDVQMPGTMDGLALARAVRDRWPPVRIIVTSGHGFGPGSDQTLPDGVSYVPKPYDPAAVIEMAREMMK